MKSGFKLLFILVVLSGCSSTNDDERILCDTGPVGFTFEIKDQTTGENLFVNGLYEERQLHIINNEGEAVAFDFETERNVVDVLLGWESKSDIYTVSIGEEIEFNIVFTLEKSIGGPCSSTSLRELEIEGATYETSETTYITTIFVNSQGS